MRELNFKEFEKDLIEMGINREIDIREIEEDVSGTCDLDARIRSRSVRQNHGLRAVVGSARRQNDRKRIAAVRGQ